MEDNLFPNEKAKPSHDVLIKQEGLPHDNPILSNDANAKEQQEITRDHEEFSPQAFFSAMLDLKGKNYLHARRQLQSLRCIYYAINQYCRVHFIVENQPSE